ncbi:MAG: hypothetical protein R2752_07645 [Vicinamibacterales bacterium]
MIRRRVVPFVLLLLWLAPSAPFAPATPFTRGVAAAPARSGFSGAPAAPAGLAGTPAAATSLPSRLSNQEFWRLSTALSEPDGFFRSENLVSNEHTYEYVIPALQQAARQGQVYLGVAPDQNFTYMIATQPAMAFIVDIRRGNLLQHLMYKAIFELSTDRADFVARLFSKTRPEGLRPDATVAEIFTAFDRIRLSDEEYQKRYQDNLSAIKAHLVKTRGFPLTPSDLQHLEEIYYAFFWDGPGIRYSSSNQRGFGGRGFSNFPTYEEMMMQTDWEGEARSYLASEANFKYVKGLEERNLIVPVVGNFAGPKALRAVGQYIREHDAVVSAFYVSNVEQYLFQDNLWDAFAANVATLPVDEKSVFIRSVSSRYGYRGPYQWSDGRASALDPIAALVADYKAGRIRSYFDVNARSK